VTLLFPDVSSYTPNVDPSKYPILIARATLSDRVSDPTYQTFKQKSAAAGTVFAAYHWLNHGNLAKQAAWCFQHVGPDVPVMIDAEDVSGNTGYAGPLTVDDITGFANEYRALGGIVSLCYLPFWYWSGPMGAPHRLGELEAAGLGLVSSNYPNAGYTENGPGWAPYYAGAPAPVQWQYTDVPIDMNAFKGTAADYANLIGVPQVAAETIEVTGMPFLARDNTTGAVYLCTDDFKSHHIPDPATVSTIVGMHVSGGRPLGHDSGAHPDWWIPWSDSAGVEVPGIVLTGWTPEAFGPVADAPQPVEVDASEVAAALAADPAFLAAIAKAVNQDAAARLKD
jgi:hypothetical protein